MRSIIGARFAFVAAAFTLLTLMMSSRGLPQIQSSQSQSEPERETAAPLQSLETEPSAGEPGAATPVLNESVKLTASDAAAGDFFGGSVSISGYTAIVGARGDDCPRGDPCGSAYIFRFNGSSWIEEQRLTASDAADNDHFGSSVSVSGDVAIVGAPGDDCESGDDCGAAYIFRYDGNVWVEGEKLTYLYPGMRDRFGTSVSLRGDVAAVGAPGNACPSGECGTVSIFRSEEAGWSYEQTLRGTGVKNGDVFASSVSISGGLCVTGAWGDVCETES